MKAPDPIAFTAFGIDVRWYGILIALGFILAIVICYRRAPYFGIDNQHILDLAIWVIPVSIVCARLYYVIFNWSNYSDDISAIINIRNGGLAIHGGLIGGLIAGFLVCKYYRLKMLDLADLVFPTVALAQAIGRWGNFFNSEAHGGPTDLPWGILVDGQYVHPTFLYESIWCFLLFCFLTWLSKRRKFSGQICCLYGVLYSVERIFVEQLRTDSLMIGPFKQAQVFSLFILIICATLYITLLKKDKQKRRI